MAEEFTLASMRRLLGKQGSSRVSLEAAEALRVVIGEYGNLLAQAAFDNMVSDGRKTILERDISMGIKALENRVLEKK